MNCSSAHIRSSLTRTRVTLKALVILLVVNGGFGWLAGSGAPKTKSGHMRYLIGSLWPTTQTGRWRLVDRHRSTWRFIRFGCSLSLSIELTEKCGETTLTRGLVFPAGRLPSLSLSLALASPVRPDWTEESWVPSQRGPVPVWMSNVPKRRTPILFHHEGTNRTVSN